MERHGLVPADFPELRVIRASDIKRMLAVQSAPDQARLFRGEPLDSSADWDAVLERLDVKELKSLLEDLRRRMKARFDRHVPTSSLLNDRWQLARDHGFGEGTSIYDECLILGSVVMGRHCWVGPFTVLDGQGGLVIGDYVDVGAGAHIYSHNTIERALTGHRAPLHRKPTKIGNCCFIAPHAIIGSGTVLGDRCFVAAGSYVEGVFPDGSYIAGNPARVVGHVMVQGDRAHVKIANKPSATDSNPQGGR
jgi:acetyltransferase-like isoleucine patch superfamily enzyme